MLRHAVENGMGREQLSELLGATQEEIKEIFFEQDKTAIDEYNQELS